MSWDADYYARADGQFLHAGGWNYTHNTSRMIYQVLDSVGWDRGEDEHGKRPWWSVVNGMSGSESVKYLSAIIDGLASEPETFRPMNPDNRWGNYDDLLVVLREMRDTAERFPSGEWAASG